MKTRWVLLVLAGGAGLRLAAGLAPEWVERYYSRGLYPWIGAALSRVSSVTSIAIGEPLAIGGALLAPAWLALRFRSAPLGRWRALAARVAGLGGVLYLAFLVVWGLNYERLPLAREAGLDPQGPTRGELGELSEALVHAADRLRAGVTEDAHGVFRLEAGLKAALARAPLGYERAAASFPWLRGDAPRPKAAAASALLSSLGISGIYCPFTAEPLVDSEIPDPEIPFAACHEMAHGLGFAREEEASYAGSLACRLHPDADFRYSGLLISSAYALAALARADDEAARRLHEERSPGVRRDLAALAAWSALHEGRVSRASRRVNDAYLRSNGQKEGIESYGRFVDLLVAELRREGRLEGAPRSR
jgi:hypothetical protein